MLLILAAAAANWVALDETTLVDLGTLEGPPERRTAMALSSLFWQEAGIFTLYGANCRTGKVWIVRTAMTTGGETIDGPVSLRGKHLTNPKTPKLHRLLCGPR